MIVSPPIGTKCTSCSKRNSLDCTKTTRNSKLPILKSRLSNCKRESEPAKPTNLKDWKIQNKLALEDNVFVMTGNYPIVKKALIDRGWTYNPDSQSDMFNLKWSVKSADVSNTNLRHWQFINHFCHSSAITTKVGLLKCMREVSWFCDVEEKCFLPRGYDLSDFESTLEFIDDFVCQEAELNLRKLFCESENLSDNFSNTYPETNFQIKSIRVNKAIYEATLEVIKSKLDPYGENYLDSEYITSDTLSNVARELNWELLINYSIFEKYENLSIDKSKILNQILRLRTQAPMKSLQEIRDKKKRNEAEKYLRNKASTSIKNMMILKDSDFIEIGSYLRRLSNINETKMSVSSSAKPLQNIWVVKPAAKSRGRGIATFNDLTTLLKYVDAVNSVAPAWIVQKYIERPLIIAERKFDIRQWVLVTSWNPLKIYFYRQFYCRFGVEKYNLNYSDLGNPYVHLVNYSIGKTSENYDTSVKAENGEDITNYMWSYEQFRDYVSWKFHDDLVVKKIQPSMKDIVVWSLKAASDSVKHRKNSWELYGFDFMVDEDLNVWLIEINSSPSCDCSNVVTKTYVELALPEIFNVVFDYEDWTRQSSKNRGNKPDTGGWEQIHDGHYVEPIMGAAAVDLTITGKQYSSPSKTNYNLNSPSKITAKAPRNFNNRVSSRRPHTSPAANYMHTATSDVKPLSKVSQRYLISIKG